MLEYKVYSTLYSTVQKIVIFCWLIIMFGSDNKSVVNNSREILSFMFFFPIYDQDKENYYFFVNQ